MRLPRHCHLRAAVQALGLGADAVLLGRPVLHGLALNGQQGVEDVINTLKAELRLNMALAGAAPPKPHSVIYGLA